MSRRAEYGVIYYPLMSALCEMGYHELPDDPKLDGREQRPLNCAGVFQAKGQLPSGSNPTEMGCCPCECHRSDAHIVRRRSKRANIGRVTSNTVNKVRTRAKARQQSKRATKRSIATGAEKGSKTSQPSHFTSKTMA
jgi:hypothetical protein